MNLQYRCGPYEDRKASSTSSCEPGNRIQFQNEVNSCQPFFSNGYKLPFFLREINSLKEPGNSVFIEVAHTYCRIFFYSWSNSSH